MSHWMGLNIHMGLNVHMGLYVQLGANVQMSLNVQIGLNVKMCFKSHKTHSLILHETAIKPKIMSYSKAKLKWNDLMLI